MKNYLLIFLKGFGIGAANIIPGVSGGTIALLTGIFERLIDAIKSINLKALKLLTSGKFKEFVQHTDLLFLITVFVGAVASIFSLAKLLGFLFENYEVYVWAFFFGLILASVFFIGKTVNKYTFQVFVSFIVGAAIAVSISLLNPASENSNFVYLILCGIVGIVSMILPGLSGSFVLILMGNYQLVMIDAVSALNFNILLPVAIGVVVGLPAFSHALSWVYKKFKDQTISVLTGFILGSLSILWPWKNPVYLTNSDGVVLSNSSGKAIVKTWERFLPETLSIEVLIAIALMLAGILSIWMIEHFAPKDIQENKNEQVS